MLLTDAYTSPVIHQRCNLACQPHTTATVSLRYSISSPASAVREARA